MIGKNAYKKLTEHMKDIMLLGGAAGNLQWDMQTYMPYKGTAQRAQQLAVISGIIHERFISEKTSNLLIDSRKLNLNSIQSRNLDLWQREYDLDAKLSTDLVKKLKEQEGRTQKLWEKAKNKSDFSMVEPELEKLYSLVKEKAEALNSDNKPLYDVLLDIYEKNVTTSMITNYFSDLKNGVVALMKKAENFEMNADILKIPVEIPRQKEISKFITEFLNLPRERTRLDEVEHPFSIGYGDDVRITTQYLQKDPMASFYSVFHESGHCLYTLNLPEEHRWTAVGGSISMGIHESQSRFIENMIGKNPAFLEFAYPKIIEMIPKYKNINFDQFVKAINSITPSLIRIYADEVTYNLHVILRFEIERELFSDKITIHELPQVWNQKMEQYLGQKIDTDAQGVLQDVHFYQGYFGYFPSYAIGNIYGGQMLATMEKTIPDWTDQLKVGNVNNILNWLDTKVHKEGSKYDPVDLVKNITGELPDAKYFIKYLNEKFGKIYGF